MESRANEGIGRHGWIALAIGLLVLLVPFSTTFQHGGGPVDEGLLLVYPEMVQRGAIPYRDFETIYGPAAPYLLAAIYTAFGTNIEVERTVGLLYRAVILIALFGLARRWGTPIATGCMLIAGWLLLPLGVVAYAWLGAMACALCFVWVMATPESSRRCFFGGVLASLAVSFRADVGLAILLVACVLLKPLPWHLRNKFILGGALAFVPFDILFFVAGPEQIFDNLFLYPVLLTGPTRRIPYSSAEPFLVRLFFAQFFVAAVNISGAIIALRASPRAPNRALFALTVLGAAILPQAWQRLDIYHVYFVVFLNLSILPLVLVSFLSQAKGRPSITLSLGAAAIVAVLVCIIAPVLPKTFVARLGEALQTEPTGSEFVHQGSRSFPVGPPERVVIIGRMLDQLDKLSTPGERLFVGPADLRATVYCDTFLYHLMPKLRPATYFLEMNPMSANRPGSRLASDIASANWLILNSEWTLPSGTSTLANYGSVEPENIVRDHFQAVGRYGSFTLFERAR
jgi:hypothetical protein